MVNEIEGVSHKKLLLITPLFWGDASGSSVYYRLLSNELLQRGYDVSVISDFEKGDDSLGISYFPLFPKRCGKDKNRMRDIVAYAVQNFTYLKINNIIKRLQPTAVLVHSSFYNHPGIFSFVFSRLLLKYPNITFIADVRDRMLPVQKMSTLNAFHKVVACSKNVAHYLRGNGVDPSKIFHIPVIQERIIVQDKEALQFLVKKGLVDKKYFFYGGLIKEEKAVDLLLDAFVDHICPKEPDIYLVLAGLMKTSSSRVKQLLSNDRVVYVGNVRRGEVLALMSKSALCVNLSPNEGMPRSSLEALSLNKLVVLPPNVPEFTTLCPEFVVDEKAPELVATRILDIFHAGDIAQYPIERHRPEDVIDHYLQILEGDRSG